MEPSIQPASADSSATTRPWLRIRHRVTSWDAWKAAFDADPIGRERAGVVCYQILRGTDDPSDVMVDLELSTAAQANAFLHGLQGLWQGPGRSLVIDPHATMALIAERVEA